MHAPAVLLVSFIPILFVRVGDLLSRHHRDGVAVGDRAYDYYSTAGNNYSKPLAGIQTPIVVGIGGLIVGIIRMFASWPFFTEYFRRRPGEAVDPAVPAADTVAAERV